MVRSPNAIFASTSEGFKNTGEEELGLMVLLEKVQVVPSA